MIIVIPEQDRVPHPLQARSLYFFCAEITPSTPTPAPTRTPPPPGRAGTSCVPDPARGAPVEWTFFLSKIHCGRPSFCPSTPWSHFPCAITR